MIKITFSANFSGAIARTNAAFGQGRTNSPILFDYVRCIGIEFRLLDCPSNGLEVHRCTHSQDVGVSCVAGSYVFSMQQKIVRSLSEIDMFSNCV